MKPLVLCSVLVVSISAMAGIWLLAANIESKPVLPRNVPRDTTREELDALVAAARQEMLPDERAGSRANVDVSEFEFGIMEPFSENSHRFVIRNDGEQTLALGDAKSNDSLVIGQFSRREIPPGEVSYLTVNWAVSDVTPDYRSVISVPTSAPDNPRLDFRIRGKVVKRVNVYPEFVVFPGVNPGVDESVDAEFIIHSSVWDDFDIAGVECSLEGVTWNFQPAEAVELDRRGAKAGYRFQVSFPGDLPTGKHERGLSLQLLPHGEEDVVNLTVPLVCKVHRRLCIYGDAIDGDGLIDLGKVIRGHGKTTHLVVKVRDPLTELPGARFEVEPSFVKVKLTPMAGGEQNGGLYDMRIEVPPLAPQSMHLIPQEHGEIRFFSDHPRIPSQTLKLRLAVIGSRNALSSPLP